MLNLIILVYVSVCFLSFFLTINTTANGTHTKSLAAERRCSLLTLSGCKLHESCFRLAWKIQDSLLATFALHKAHTHMHRSIIYGAHVWAGMKENTHMQWRTIGAFDDMSSTRLTLERLLYGRQAVHINRVIPLNIILASFDKPDKFCHISC